MASNFKISIHHNSNNPHLNLLGDFDGTSTEQLINVLKEKTNSVYKVIIHTNSLKNIYPFGQDMLRQNLPELKSCPIHILFIGPTASLTAPKEEFCI
jgi:hypothetical protein